MSYCDDVDRLSSLPMEAIELILMQLPLEDAVRTSILSRRWRYAWTRIPNISLTLDETSDFSGQSQVEYDHWVEMVIDQVLLQHQGPILKFHLHVYKTSTCHINRWLPFLLRNGIGEFRLENHSMSACKLPLCLLSYQGITELYLFNCIFPSHTEAYPTNLRTLTLESVAIEQPMLHCFIARCHLLVKVELIHLEFYHPLEICSSSLVDLSIEGYFVDLSIVDAPSLAFLYVNVDEYDYLVYGSICNIVGKLSSIKSLEFGGLIFKQLSLNHDPVALPSTCHLERFCADINIDDVDEMSAALSLFRISPFLTTLEIQCYSSGYENENSAACFWGEQESLGTAFGNLRSVKMAYFTGIQFELMFLKYVLANAPVLETADIEFYSEVNSEILKQIVRFKRMSSKAEVVIA